MARTLKPDPAALAKASPEAPRSLAQEKSDFTAEGSPPPGQVAGQAPVLPSDVAAAESPSAPATTTPTGRRPPPSPAGPVRRSSKRTPAPWRGNS